MKEFRENPENRFDTEMRLKALEDAKKNQQARLEEEDRMGVPSDSEGKIFDWIRNRIDMPDDMAIETRNMHTTKTSTETKTFDQYAKDLEILKSFTRQQLWDLLQEQERKSKEGRGLFSKGPLLQGYAIDPVTLRSRQDRKHDLSKFGLAGDIARDSASMLDIDKLENRIVPGFVYLEVPGIQTPIVKLYVGINDPDGWNDRLPTDIIRKIVNKIKDEKKLLPIDSRCEIL